MNHLMIRMSRAAEVFYDYVINYAPEMISPQHNSFYDAAVKLLPQNTVSRKEVS